MGQVVDIVILLVCAFFAIRALFRGFIVEVFSLLAFIAGYWGAKLLGPVLGKKFISLGPESVILIASYAISFLIFYILIKIIERLLSRFVHVILLGGLDKVLGLIFGVIEGLVIMFVVTKILLTQTIIDIDFQTMFDASIILNIISPYVNEGINFMGI